MKKFCQNGKVKTESLINGGVIITNRSIPERDIGIRKTWLLVSGLEMRSEGRIGGSMVDGRCMSATERMVTQLTHSSYL